jgi:trigger factor
MKTTVTELPESRRKIEAEVPAEEVENRIKAAAERLGKEMKIEGFRKGKVPPEMVLQRLGRDAVLNEAIEASLAEWYVSALDESKVRPVGDPSISLEKMPGDGEPLTFAFEVSIRPDAKLGKWKGVEAPRAEADVPVTAVEGELERLREAFARLEPVEGRKAAQGDAVVLDYEGKIDGDVFEGGSASDFLLEIGGGQVLPDFEKPLLGADAGSEVIAEVDFPDDYPAEEIQGKHATFTIQLKEIREKVLPDLDDDFAAEASEFETKEALERQSEEAFRAAALDAAVAVSKVDLPDAVIDGRALEMWRRLERALAQQGISGERYAQMQGKTTESMIAEIRPDAEQALKREAVLEAVAESEKIEIGEEEMLEALAIPATKIMVTPSRRMPSSSFARQAGRTS